MLGLCVPPTISCTKFSVTFWERRLESSELGRLEQVDVRTVWTNEATEFTPWLARQENLDILGETLGLSLETESVEKEVGSFRADIVCLDTNTDTTVLIENQLARTDHDHLGKLLTYASGLHAKTVLWVVTQVRDEHRAALDWLNTITSDDYRFFGVEIELLRIGASPIAPRFNIVSTPNDWSRSVAIMTENKPTSETKLKQLEYWESFHSVLNELNGSVFGNGKPGARHWITYHIGRSGFWLAAVIYIKRRWVRVELYISGEGANDRLNRLEEEKNPIEQELGFELEWGDQSSNARARRISRYLRDVDPTDKADWSRQHEWLADNLNAMHRVFVDRVKNL